MDCSYCIQEKNGQANEMIYFRYIKQKMSSSDANESLETLTQALLVIFDSFGEEYIQTDV